MDPKLVKTFKELGDLYKILGIEPTDDKKAIKRAYKKQVLIHHPDKSKAVDANDIFIKIEQAYRILTDTDLKTQFDKYKQNQQYHAERSAKQDKDRKKFADDLLSREKATSHKNTEEKERKMTKEEQQREDSKKMKREWAQEEEKRKEELEKKRVEKVESKEYTMIKVKWPKNDRLTYNEDILKIIFGKYGDIKDVVVFPADRKALIEFKFRLSAEKAYKENKTKEKEKLGFDDGLSVSLMVKEKEKEEQNGKPNDMTLNSNNIEKISKIFNRDSKILVGSKEEMLRQNQERQRVIDEILAKEGLSK